MNLIKKEIQENCDWFGVELSTVQCHLEVRRAIRDGRDIAARILSRRLVWWATRAEQLRAEFTEKKVQKN